MSDLTGKVAIVTGASKGIGAGIARAFAAAGANVVVNYASSRSDGERVVAEIEAAGGTAIAVGCDVSNEDDVARLVNVAVEAYGRIDILVNNAAHFTFGPIDDVTAEDARRHLEVNVLGPLLLIREAIKHMGQGGSIINIGSAGTINPKSNCVLYAATKGALERATLFLSKELGPRGIRVNMVRPGFTMTEGNKRVGTFDKPETIEALLKITSLGRIGLPEDVAPAVTFLASDDAQWITGAILDASGGFP